METWRQRPTRRRRGAKNQTAVPAGGLQRQTSARCAHSALEGRTSSALDNAISECFVATLKVEFIDRRRFPPLSRGGEEAIFEYLEAFYNRRRLRSSLRYRSPQSYEEASREGVALT